MNGCADCNVDGSNVYWDKLIHQFAGVNSRLNPLLPVMLLLIPFLLRP
jgi:hypothetical protein